MTVTTRILCFSFLAFSLLLPALSSAWAAEASVKIGLFDVQKIIEGLNADMPVKKGEVKLEGLKLTSAEREEVLTINREMARTRGELNRDVLSQADIQRLTEERKQYGQRFKAIREKAWEREAGQQTLTEDDIAAAVTRYGKEQAFTLLVEKTYWTEGVAKNAVIFPGKAIDITPAIVQRLKAEAQRGQAKKEPQKKGVPVPPAKP